MLVVLVVVVPLVGGGAVAASVNCHQALPGGCVAGSSPSSSPSRIMANESRIGFPLGRALNTFHDYGFMSLNILVAPLPGNDTAMFQVVTHDVLDATHLHRKVRKIARFHLFILLINILLKKKSAVKRTFSKRAE